MRVIPDVLDVSEAILVSFSAEWGYSTQPDNNITVIKIHYLKLESIDFSSASGGHLRFLLRVTLCLTF